MTVTHPYYKETKTIDRKNPNQAHRALGWIIKTDGKSTAQFKVLIYNARHFSGAILQRHIQIYDTVTAYNCHYIAIASHTVERYNPLFRNQCKTIKSPVICATPNKMGINRNLVQAIVFGPKRLGGMALIHLHTRQGIIRLQYFIGHITANYRVRKLIHICIEATQLEVNTFEPFTFLRLSLHVPTLLTNSWVQEIWSFLKLFQGTITESNNFTPSSQWVNHQSIISLAVLFTNHKGELRQIRMYCIFIQVISTSDITNFYGAHILQHSYDDTFTDNKTNIRWPNKQRPTRGD
jgi:hypothetical protein